MSSAMNELDEFFILFGEEEEEVGGDKMTVNGESTTDSQLAYLIGDVRRLDEAENQNQSLSSKVCASIISILIYSYMAILNKSYNAPNLCQLSYFCQVYSIKTNSIVSNYETGVCLI